MVTEIGCYTITIFHEFEKSFQSFRYDLRYKRMLFFLLRDMTIHRKFTVPREESINIPTDVPMFVQLHIVGTRVALETLYDDPALFLSISVSKRIYR